MLPRPQEDVDLDFDMLESVKRTFLRKRRADPKLKLFAIAA